MFVCEMSESGSENYYFTFAVTILTVNALFVKLKEGHLQDPVSDRGDLTQFKSWLKLA